MWKNGLKHLSVILITSVLSLGLVELSLRLLAQFRQNYDVEMWRYANILKTPVQDERSHIHTSSKEAFIMGKDVKLNSKGLRDREFTYEKKSNTTRILSVGDSYTFGFGATQEKTFTKILEKKLRENNPERSIEILNMGVGNYNSKQELAALKLEGLKYKPDHILWNFYINDAEETQSLKPSFLSTKLISLVYLKSFIYKVNSSLNPGMDYVAFYKTTFKNESSERLFKTLEELIILTKNEKIALTVVLLPDFRKLRHYPFAEEHKLIVDYFSKNGINTIDTVEAFNPQKEKEYWVAHDDPHPNDDAHEVIADKIIQDLKL